MNPRTIYFSKTNPKAKIPSKREEDAAFDIYACFNEDYICIKPHQTEIIPTGIASAFPINYVALLKERSSTGIIGIGQRAGVIDSGYRGEWLIPITNHNNKTLVIMKKECKQLIDQDIIIYPYEKAISQCLIIEVPQLEIEIISYDELSKFKSERGTGGFGSSNK